MIQRKQAGRVTLTGLEHGNKPMLQGTSFNGNSQRKLDYLKFDWLTISFELRVGLKVVIDHLHVLTHSKN